MKFSVTGSELTSRSFLEGLAEEGTAILSHVSCKVKVSPKLLIGKATEGLITVTYFKKTSNMVVSGPMAILDQCLEALRVLEAAYVVRCQGNGNGNGGWGASHTCSMPAQGTWRIPPRSDFMGYHRLPQLVVTQETADEIPDETATPEFRAAVNAIAVVAQRELAMFPTWQEKMLQILRAEFGVDVIDAMEDSSYVQVDKPLPAQPASRARPSGRH